MSEQSLKTIENAVDDLTFLEIKEARKLLDHAEKKKEREARKQAEHEINEIAAKYGMKPEDIVSGQSGTRTGKKTIPPKYQDPESGKTWTGRGAQAQVGRAGARERQEPGRLPDRRRLTPIRKAQGVHRQGDPLSGGRLFYGRSAREIRG